MSASTRSASRSRARAPFARRANRRVGWLFAVAIAMLAAPLAPRADPADPALTAAIAGQWREPEARARDVYRHPLESLTFGG
jgi:hypothetical protein